MAEKCLARWVRFRYHHEQWEIIVSLTLLSPSSSLVSSIIPYGDRGAIFTVWDDRFGVRIFRCDDILYPSLHHINVSGFGNNQHTGGKVIIVGDQILACTATDSPSWKCEVWLGTNSGSS